nr:unnamed protein product [Callosobruchus analis]
MNDQTLGFLDGDYTTYLSDDSVETEDDGTTWAAAKEETDVQKSVTFAKNNSKYFTTFGEFHTYSTRYKELLLVQKHSSSHVKRSFSL